MAYQVVEKQLGGAYESRVKADVHDTSVLGRLNGTLGPTVHEWSVR